MTPGWPQAHRRPDGSEIAPANDPQPDGALVMALARAWRWQGLRDSGMYKSVTEIAEAEGIGKLHVSRILRPAMLAADLVEAILAERADQARMLGRPERLLPAVWEKQYQRVLSAGTF